MNRLRLGVALLVDGRIGAEIDGLRRALGFSALRTQSPHLTLVAPVNVRADALGSALTVLRRAAALVPGPLRCALGPVTTFAPDAPVLYLTVTEPDDSGAPPALASMHHLRKLHAGVNVEPLLRKMDRPFVPHVTVHADADPPLIPPALRLLGSYRVEVTFDRVWLLEQGPDRVWRRLADVPFGEPVVRGRGGVELAIRRCHLVSPDVEQALVGSAPDGSGLDANGMTGPPRRSSPTADPVADERRSAESSVFDVRIADAPVAAARVRGAGPIWTLDRLDVVEAHRRQGIGARLLSEVVTAAATSGADAVRLARSAGTLTPWQRDWLGSHGWRRDSRLYPDSFVRVV